MSSFEWASNILRADPLDLLSHDTRGALSSNNTRHNNIQTTAGPLKHHPMCSLWIIWPMRRYASGWDPHRTDKLTLLEDARRS